MSLPETMYAVVLSVDGKDTTVAISIDAKAAQNTIDQRKRAAALDALGITEEAIEREIAKSTAKYTIVPKRLVDADAKAETPKSKTKGAKANIKN